METRDGMQAVERRKAGGRPRNAEASANVCTRVTVGTFDRLQAAANRQDMSVSAYVRRVLVMTLDRKP